MSATQPEETDILDSALPETPQKRDTLGQTCFYHHFVTMGYIVTGWAYPIRPLLWFYVFFIPLVVLQWRVNKNSCVLNNLESLIRTGRWRNPQNKEEGGWFFTLVQEKLGLKVTHLAVDIFIYSLMGLFFGLGLSHLNHWLFWS
jgi:hypothetical protein